MVSLSRSYNTSAGGAIFFSESINMGDNEQLLPVLESFGRFKTVRTTSLIGCHFLFTLILYILAIIFAIQHPDENSNCKEYFIIIYLHVALWFITFIIHLRTKCIHNDIRLCGYFEFYQSIEHHGKFSIILVSLWTAVLLLLQALMQHVYSDNFVEKCVQGGSMSPKSYICAFITGEFCIFQGINIDYIVKVVKFNKEKSPPDILKNEWISSGNPDTFNQNEIGYTELGGKVYEFLEKQAELIKYLKEHNAKLAEKVLILSSQLNKPDINNPLNVARGSSNN